jgi:hypothetical protein
MKMLKTRGPNIDPWGTPLIILSLNDTIIKPAPSMKNLVATIDKSLSFDAMDRSVLQKANARLKYLYREKDYLTQYTKKILILVMSLIQCHFDYSCSTWNPGLFQFLENKLQVTQNMMIRCVLDHDTRSHIGPNDFCSPNWLSVNKRIDQIILYHVFKRKKCLGRVFHPTGQCSFLHYQVK